MNPTIYNNLKKMSDIAEYYASIVDDTDKTEEEKFDLVLIGIYAAFLSDNINQIDRILQSDTVNKNPIPTDTQHSTKVTDIQSPQPSSVRSPDLSMGVGMALGGLLHPIASPIDFDSQLEDQQISEFHHMMKDTDFGDI